MLRKVIFVGLCLTSLLIDAIAPQHFTFNRSLRSSSSISSFNTYTFFYVPIVISEPGTYLLADSVMFTPTDYNASYVTITTDNVLLDLNSSTITQDPTTLTFTGVNGISIAPGVKNVVIRNGAFNSLTGSAILVNDGVEIVDIFDLTILNMGIAGIMLEGLTTGSGITSANFSNIDIEGSGASGNGIGNAYGFLLQNVSTCNIETSVCGQSMAPMGDAYGMRFENCDSIRIKSSVINNNSSGATKAAGFSVLSSNNILCIDTISSNNSCTALNPTTTTAGFEILNSQAIFLQECSATSNAGYGAAYGFYLDGCSFCKMEGDDALANFSTGSSSMGFFSNNGTNNLFKNCDSMSNDGALNGYGILLTGTETGSGVSNGTIEANIGLTGTAFGVFLDPQVVVSGVFQTTIAGHMGGVGGFGIYDSAADASTNSFFANIALKNSSNYFLSTAMMSELFTGPLSVIPGTFQNISL